MNRFDPGVVAAIGRRLSVATHSVTRATTVSTPVGVAAISRRLSVATPPDARERQNPTPAGVAAIVVDTAAATPAGVVDLALFKPAVSLRSTTG